MRAAVVDPHHKTLCEVLKPLHHKFLLWAWRPLRPAEALFVKRCFLILTFIERLFCQLVESWDLSEHGGDEIRNVKSEAGQEFFFQWSIDLVHILRYVCEAACIEEPRRLLEG